MSYSRSVKTFPQGAYTSWYYGPIYDHSSINNDTPIQADRFYVDLSEAKNLESLTYVVMNPASETITATLKKDELFSIMTDLDDQRRYLRALKSKHPLQKLTGFLPYILQITSQKGHTLPMYTIDGEEGWTYLPKYCYVQQGNKTIVTATKEKEWYAPSGISFALPREAYLLSDGTYTFIKPTYDEHPLDDHDAPAPISNSSPHHHKTQPEESKREPWCTIPRISFWKKHQDTLGATATIGALAGICCALTSFFLSPMASALGVAILTQALGLGGYILTCAIGIIAGTSIGLTAGLGISAITNDSKDKTYQRLASP